MKITKFNIRNFRTLDEVDIKFSSSYTAICGRNDSGKTNIVRAIRALMKEEKTYPVISFENDGELSIEDDFPKWKETPVADRQISLEVHFSLDRQTDAGFFQFLTRQLSLEDFDEESLDLEILVVYGSERPAPVVTVQCLGKTYADLEAQEVLKRLQTSRSILFHNSTEPNPMLPFHSYVGRVLKSELSEHEQLITTMQKTINDGLDEISKTHQKEIENLLGRLESKYQVGLSMLPVNFNSIPYNITLGESMFQVPLHDWGSGTVNRTLILMALFRAKQISEAEASANKVTPIIVIEEPESFLHPAAQAEFGRVLHDLAEEFQVQVVITTHSPYLLNLSDVGSNLLLDRNRHDEQLRETTIVDTSGDNWARPFSLALGLVSEELSPWRSLMLTSAKAILLVEGDVDKEYFEMLRDKKHGDNRLDFEGEVVSYGGTGSLNNSVLLRFIKDRYEKLFVTYDLDSEKEVVKSLEKLDMKQHEDYCHIGIDSAGKRNIEGLVPEKVRGAVYAANTQLVQEATQGNREEQRSAKGKLKRLMLAQFQKEATPGPEYFGKFYRVAKIINEALNH